MTAAVPPQPLVPPRGVRFVHWTFAHGTHQPVLFETAMRCRGPMVEFGCGEGSTRLLHAVGAQRGVPLLSLESDPAWMARYERRYASDLHTFKHVDDWIAVLDDPRWDEQRWGLVFVDQGSWEGRAATVRRLCGNAEYVVVHDCDALAGGGLLGRQLRPLVGPADLGERDYADVFTSWREHFPLEPWPLPSGPPTLLGSNVHDVDDLEISYEAYLPSRGRRLAHRLATSAARIVARER